MDAAAEFEAEFCKALGREIPRAIISQLAVRHNALLCVLATAKLHKVTEIIPDLERRIDSTAILKEQFESAYRKKSLAVG